MLLASESAHRQRRAFEEVRMRHPARFGDNRMLGLSVGYLATDWHFPMTFSRYLDEMADWKVQPILRDGHCIGAAYSRAGEVHASILPEWRRRWATRGLLEGWFKEAAVDGRVTTRISVGHEYMVGIMERLGFVMGDNGVMTKEVGNGR